MDIFDEKLKRVDDMVKRNEDRLNRHGERLDKLDYFKSSTETEMKNLISQISDLISIIKWFMGFTISSLVAFFIWYIQTL